MMKATKAFWKMGIFELSSAYAKGIADPLAVVDELEARITRLNPGLNAYVALSGDLREQARESAERLGKGSPRSVLEGIPVAIKDNLSVAGLPATWGSEVYSDEIRQVDELPIQRLRASGAILCGKTNTPEFSVEGYTANRLFGVTRNPWNPALTPGGSSGGTVAAVAAGLAQAGVGTDGGGSTRRPAGHTGLFGLKPSIGSIPRCDGLPQILMDFEVIGTFARSALDLRMIYQVMAGEHRCDPASRRIPVSFKPDAGLKILAVEDISDNPCDPYIRASFREAVERLRRLGHTVIEGTLPFELAPLDEFWPKLAQIGLAYMQATVPGMTEKASMKYQEMASLGAEVSAPELYAALMLIRQLRMQVSFAFADWDIIMMPSAAAQPWPAEEVYPRIIDGQSVGPRGHAVYTGWVNASGHPALSLPALPDSTGLPIGVQIVGDLYSEEMLLGIAAAFEAAGPGWSWPDYASG
jgi:aspartyl-tRNA(Asn)/glutamyl-tRNA(Gln) amidotransferase subunit A